MRNYIWQVVVSVTEEDVMDFFDLEDVHEITGEMYDEVASAMLGDDMGEYFFEGWE